MNFATIVLRGGLGNQLFQLFTLLSLSWRCHYSIILPSNLSQVPSDTQRNVYWLTLLENLSVRILKDGGSIVNVGEGNTFFASFPESQSGFTQIPCQRDKNVILNGYFQKYKYFNDNKTKLFDYLGLRRMKKKVLLENSHILKGHTVSMHFRRGD